MNVTFFGRHVDELSDDELALLLSVAAEGNKLRQVTAQMYVSILRALDRAGPPMTVRQMFYALVSAGAIPKTERSYKRASYHLLQMRRRGLLPYEFIADNTRWMRKPRSYDSLEGFLNISKDAYRRALWANQDAYVEIWCEKDALAGVIYDVTKEWDVPLMVTRGFASETFVFEAAENIKAQSKPTFVYFLADHDPSGASIAQTVRRRLQAFGAMFHFEQLAVLPWQIGAWQLPTRPTKGSDSRARNWRGGSVELDAIPVATLRQLVEDAISQHVDERELKETRRAERLERETLEAMVDNLGLD